MDDARPWYVCSWDHAVAAQQAQRLVTARWLWWRDPASAGPPFSVARIEATEWGSAWGAGLRKATNGSMMLCLRLEVTWRRGGGTVTEWDGSETYHADSSGVRTYWASNLYVTWAEARGGWPLPGDRVVATLPEGELHTQIVRAADEPDTFVVTGERVVSKSALRPFGGADE